jgi:D-arabinose 1-dehydrogenase-like Zn-dependent alcohol dehydrogenase
MRAVVMHKFGPPETLALEHVPSPEPGPGDVRVTVAAVAVMRNRDVATRSGTGPFSAALTLPAVLGGEHAGVVDAVGPGVSKDLLGRRVAVSAVVTCGRCRPCRTGQDEVCGRFELVGIHRPGAYAERCVVPAGNVYPIPDELPFALAAVLAATGPVACAQLDAAAVAGGAWLAVTGANGMLGSTLVSLAAHRGTNVVAIVRGPAGAERAARGGAAEVLISGRSDFAGALRAVTGDEGLTAVIDNLAGSNTWSDCVQMLAPHGRIVVSGALDTGIVALDVRRLYLRSQTIIGIRTGNAAQRRAFWHCVAAGFRPPSDDLVTLSLERATEAHQALELGTASAPVVLVPRLPTPQPSQMSEVARA